MVYHCFTILLGSRVSQPHIHTLHMAPADVCVPVCVSPSAKLFAWSWFPEASTQGTKRGRLCGLLKFFLNGLLQRWVCLVAMEMCAVGLPLPQRALPTPGGHTPDWRLSGAVGTVGWGEGTALASSHMPRVCTPCVKWPVQGEAGACLGLERG